MSNVDVPCRRFEEEWANRLEESFQLHLHDAPEEAVGHAVDGQVAGQREDRDHAAHGLDDLIFGN